jgi:protein-disulfide isomerase
VDDDALIRLAVPVDEDDHVRGRRDAPVTLLEYGDFECPYCAQAYPLVKQLQRRYPDTLRFVFRSFPLQQHPHAYAAAETAEFAADHGMFWEMHDLLFEHTHALDRTRLLEYATRLGLDREELVTALRTETYRVLIDEIKEGGEESGIPGTPAFFLNGVLFEDELSIDALSHAVEWLLERGTVS